METRYFGFCVLLLLVLIASHEEMVEAKVCRSRSRYFKGHCGYDHICAVVCRDEGWSGGRCHTIHLNRRHNHHHHHPTEAHHPHHTEAAHHEEAHHHHTEAAHHEEAHHHRHLLAHRRFHRICVCTKLCY